MKFHSITGPYTLEHAIEHARHGRPEMLLMIIGDKLGEEARDVLAHLLKNPTKLQRQFRGAVLPHEAVSIRAHFAALKRAHPDTSPEVLRDLLGPRIGVNPGTLRDIIEQKKSYADPDAVGEQKRKRSPPKPKR